MAKKLHSVNVYPDSTGVIFKVSHNNLETTMEFELELVKTDAGWKAMMDFDEVEHDKTITASAWKLAECFERMAEEIKKHEFDEINFNSL